MDRRRLLNIFFVVFLDMFGFGLILPLVTYIADDFGASATQIGLLLAAYPATQMVGSSLLGRLSDRYGRRPLLLVSILGTCLSLLWLGLATSIWMLFAARMLDGLTGGNISVAQAYITDVTDEDNRARGLGLIGAAFGLGFILGPSLGGMLSIYGFAVPAFVAAGLSFLNWLGVLIWLPESLTPEQRAATDLRTVRIFDWRHLLATFRRPLVGSLLVVRSSFALAFNTFQTIFPLYALVRFGLDARQTGFVLAYVGVLVVLVQGVAMGPITRRYPERLLIMVSLPLTGLALLGWALSPSVPVLLLIMIPMAAGAGIFNTVINSALSKAVAVEEVGGMLGLSTALESLTRVVSPSASGAVLGAFGPLVPGLIGATIVGLTLPYAWWHLRVRAVGALMEPLT